MTCIACEKCETRGDDCRCIKCRPHWTRVVPGNIIAVSTFSSQRTFACCGDRREVDNITAAAGEVQTKHRETSTPESRHDFGINGMAGFVTNRADAIRKKLCVIRSSPRATATFN